ARAYVSLLLEIHKETLAKQSLQCYVCRHGQQADLLRGRTVRSRYWCPARSRAPAPSGDLRPAEPVRAANLILAGGKDRRVIRVDELPPASARQTRSNSGHPWQGDRPGAVVGTSAQFGHAHEPRSN